MQKTFALTAACLLVCLAGQVSAQSVPRDEQQVANATNTTMADFHTSLSEQQILRNHIITPARHRQTSAGLAGRSEHREQ
jgi:hypothetical protein